MSMLDRRVRRLECRSAASTASLTVVLNYVSMDGNETEAVRLRYDRPGWPPMRSEDGGRTWESAEGTQ